MAAQRGPDGRFPKGVSGNPAGRKPSVGLKDAILADLDRVDGLSGHRRLERLAQRLGDLALEGDSVALRLVVDRLWPARLELQHDGETTLRVVDRTDTRRDNLAHEPRESATDERLPVRELRPIPPAPPAPAAPIAEPAPTFFLRRPIEDLQDAAD